VKPGNLFLTKNGDLQLGDFGVAKILASNGDCATAQVGTPYYLSPEVCLGRQYNCASDIWAVGCVLHELCTLHVPFEAANISELAEKICKATIPSFSGYSEGVQNLCRRMLNRNPDERGTAIAVLQSSVLQPVLELEASKSDTLNSQEPRSCARSVCISKRRYTSDGSNTTIPYREGDQVEYLLKGHNGQWIATTVIAVSKDGSICVASNPSRWLSRDTQASGVRLLCIREALMKVGGNRKRAPSPSFTQLRTCATVRQRVDNVVEALASPERLAPSDFLSKCEVTSRLLGRPIARHDGKQ